MPENKEIDVIPTKREKPKRMEKIVLRENAGEEQPHNKQPQNKKGKKGIGTAIKALIGALVVAIGARAAIFNNHHTKALDEPHQITNELNDNEENEVINLGKDSYVKEQNYKIQGMYSLDDLDQNNMGPYLTHYLKAFEERYPNIEELIEKDDPSLHTGYASRDLMGLLKAIRLDELGQKFDNNDEFNMDKFNDNYHLQVVSRIRNSIRLQERTFDENGNTTYKKLGKDNSKEDFVAATFLCSDAYDNVSSIEAYKKAYKSVLEVVTNRVGVKKFAKDGDKKNPWRVDVSELVTDTDNQLDGTEDIGQKDGNDTHNYVADGR